MMTRKSKKFFRKYMVVLVFHGSCDGSDRGRSLNYLGALNRFNNELQIKSIQFTRLIGMRGRMRTKFEFQYRFSG
jgi:hypothetical protein